MRSIHIVMIALGLTLPATGAAQSAVTPAGADTSSPGSTSPAPKKKGGLFGKVKDIAKNKVVRTVAKTAACTMLPGGQLIAGAIDAGSKKDAVGGAAALATGSGSGCMPGMTGQGLAGKGMAAAAAAAAGSAGVLPGQPTVATPAMEISPDQMKQMQEHYRRMGIDPAGIDAMQGLMAGQPAAEPYSLVKEKSRIVLRRLPWAPGSAAMQAGVESVLGEAIAELATEIMSTTKNYRIEVRVEQQGGNRQSQLLAKRRAAVIIGALTSHGVPSTRLSPGGGAADNDPRVVVSESKPVR